MNYKDLQYKYSKRKSSKLKNEKYQLTKGNFSASTWKDYKDWLKEQRLKEEIQKKVQNRSKRKKVDNCQLKKKKINSEAGNNLKSNHMSYDEQLKDERWLKKRKEVLDKKGYVCSDCGSRFNLEVHHLEYKKGKKAWEYPMSNFVVLCRNCHKKIHGLT